ncbi:cytochrome ubiquinol oxidase subunit I [Gammaproteobacteria bacterium]|nr:cytochrome ubiquinol oxidase subunit I [Gammaproteobacteria bacterium]
MFTTEILSRLQFAFTITFHGVFPTLNIGLGLFLVYWEYRYLVTESPVYKALCKFWSKIFALSFGMGVVTGVVLAYEIGANFSGFTYFAGNILGPLMAMETLSAFFLEAGFLGVMLYGWEKVSPRVHFFATLMVCLGTIISLMWIMSANSFMHTPAGYSIESGVLVPDSWLEAIFNPSYVIRAWHMMMACVLSTSFVIMGVSSYYFLKKQHVIVASRSFVPALTIACIFSIMQVGVGDFVGINVLENQPIKTAAMEGNWVTQPGAPLILFAWPDQALQKNHYEIKIPKLASLINTHSLEGVLPGLDQAPRELQPPVKSVFFTFRIMVGIGFLFVLLSLSTAYFTHHRTLFRKPWLLKILILSTPLGFIATVCGWMTSEIGRQPWTVYGLLLTKDAVSKLPAEQVLFSLITIFILYMAFFTAYVYFIIKTVRLGPMHIEEPDGLGYLIGAEHD